ncbi:MAG: 30S ribosomal protein S20 [Peptoniphilaceae bacterium]|nr:30S ribosomal protein S20 [Peptoniphilaceae bacterium]MDD7383779.1 30S ribosomal protein S20 [Peptoniphilaceae bacterium]MDY3738107.1 30S ribosomal protein S20 [Peptoniphilaceae bacterium]
MANIKSAKKRISVSRRQAAENKIRKSQIKTYIRHFDECLEAGELEKASEYIKLVDKKSKQAASKNVIHKNKAARTTSRLTKKLNAAMA